MAPDAVAPDAVVRDAGRQRGSVLLLVPAGVLVLVILGAIAVDAAIAFLAQRELAGLATAAANDAAAAAAAGPRYYAPGTGGQVAVDPALARRSVDRSLAGASVPMVAGLQVDVRTTATHVCVTLTGRVAYLFARAVPGAAASAAVTGRGVAAAAQGPPAGPVPTGGDC